MEAGPRKTARKGLRATRNELRVHTRYRQPRRIGSIERLAPPQAGREGAFFGADDIAIDCGCPDRRMARPTRGST